MKEREKQILEFIIENRRVKLDQLVKQFDISKRTLYYDIQSINYYIKSAGEIKNINHEFSFIGDYSKLHSTIKIQESKFLNIEYRKNYILYKILNGEQLTIDKLADEMILSRNTIVQTMDEIKKDLKDIQLALTYKRKYEIVGNEYKIRELYLLLMQDDEFLLRNISEEVSNFDEYCSMGLTDYSLGNLTRFAEFICRRINENCTLTTYKYKNDSKKFNYYPFVKYLLPPKVNEDEISYLSAYISTLSSLNSKVDEDLISNYIDKLIQKFEAKTAITLDSKEEFKSNMKRHLLSAYNRIKFKFPISNPSLEEIKFKHESLYKIIKSIIENEKDFPDFIGIREEEIGFIAAYFGGYLRGERDSGARRNKVLVVCPNGLMVSKTLEIQLYKYIPTIDIAGVLSLKELSETNIYYDYIISTVEIPDKENVIVVNPLLTKLDIQLLMSKLINFNYNDLNFDLELIMQVIKKHTKIIDEKRLKDELLKIMYKFEEKEIYQPMLKELVTADRIRKVKRVDNWKEAVKLAAKPLLDDGSIETIYIDNMIESIIEHGPYIVLADRFALPHASSKNGVNKLSMSLLVVEEEVDLLGKPVNIFMVLAATDNNSHIKALASLSEMLYDTSNIDILITGNEESILELINKQD
ncbi:MAG: BglG family transcription antiterminator [Anaerocolumna aminovalerica]|jgi:mannitol operon transcriptional antiterminator|uniref:BglG family transcription antiterminator n=1 Tax=Anaerocolumna aminovalerica TaxID=1527 RepID=UPI000BE3BD1F|nr:BglG family transcription antiterminator [Anaerocolumna aminovalerica]MDU6264545.1 BglG family transcription antiterminator [Anaerocolumna aminovalerica]